MEGVANKVTTVAAVGMIVAEPNDSPSQQPSQEPSQEPGQETSRLVSLSEFLAGKVALDNGFSNTPDDDEEHAVLAAMKHQRLKPVNFSNARTGRIMDPEVWMDYWSDELVTLWDGLKEHAGAMGAAVLDTCEFPAFAQFCWYHSSRYPPAA